MNRAHSQTCLHKIFIWCLYDEYAATKRLVCAIFLKVERVLHFLMDNGRLFHRVAAAYQYHLLPYLTPCIFRTVISESDSSDRHLPSEVLFPNATWCNLSLKYDLMQDRALPVTPYESSSIKCSIIVDINKKD